MRRLLIECDNPKLDGSKRAVNLFSVSLNSSKPEVKAADQGSFSFHFYFWSGPGLLR